MEKRKILNYKDIPKFTEILQDNLDISYQDKVGEDINGFMYSNAQEFQHVMSQYIEDKINIPLDFLHSLSSINLTGEIMNSIIKAVNLRLLSVETLIKSLIYDILTDELKMNLLSIFIRNNLSDIYISDEYGKTHIIIYSINNLLGRYTNENLMSRFTIWLMFLSRTNNSIFSSIDGKSIITVKEVIEKKYQDLLKYFDENIEEDLDPRAVKLINILLDSKENINYSSIQDSLSIISCRSVKIFSRMTITNSEDVLKNILKYLSEICFEIYILKGETVSYNFISRCVGNISKYRRISDFTSIKSVLNMINLSVENGVEIDQVQIDEIEQFDRSESVKILNKYSRPYFSKICRVKYGIIPEKLKNKIYGIYGNSFLNYDKRFICNNLTYLNQVNETDLYAIIKNINRQNIPDTFKNIFDISYFETSGLNDSFLYYYTDSNYRKYIFNHLQFDEILKTKRNPENNEKLPDNVISQVQWKKEDIQNKRLKPTTRENIESIISEPDSINQYIHSEGNVNEFLTRRNIQGDKTKVQNFFNQINKTDSIGQKDLIGSRENIFSEEFYKLSEEDKMKAI